MKKILFVCLGNICRSPGAEAIMKAWIKKEGKEKEFLIDSAGLYSGHAGALLDERDAPARKPPGDMSWIVVPVLFIRLPILQSSI